MRTVTSVEKYKGLCYRVDFDVGEPLFLHRDVVTEFSLKSGVKLPEVAEEQIAHASELRRAKERALYLLDVRDYSFAELFEKLERNYTEQTCFEVMQRMVELGVINDRRYAERLAEHLMETKKFGYYRAKQEMRRKGLDSELIDEMLAPYEDSTTERLAELVERKYARYLTDEKGVKKVKTALVRQGYSFRDIKEVLDEYDADDDSELD